MVLLSVERNKNSTMIKIANPLYGVQHKSEEEMKDYCKIVAMGTAEDLD